MSVNRLFNLVFLFVIVLLLGLPAHVQSAKAVSHVLPPAQQMPSITLRLAVADANDAPSAPIVLAFVEQVQQRSGGSLVIEPVWEAGADTEAEFEQGVLAAVRAGEYELGLAATRAWEEQGVTVFQPLQTPFLIDDDALGTAVATSEIATQMLEGLSASGMIGLTMWPESLRHPVSVVPGQPLLAPEDFTGKTFRIYALDVTAALVEALGGTPEYLASEFEGAESGLRDASPLTGLPIATGNVVFYTKFQVLFANSAAFEELDESQRAILREAAAAAQQKAIAERPTEAEAGENWCADGGSIVLASAEQVVALQAAAQPVIDQIAQNPEHAEVLAALQALKAATPPAPLADVCGSQTALAASNDAEPVWSEGLPPNGTWTVDLSADDLVAMGVLRSKAETDWAGTYSFTFDGDTGEHHGSGPGWTAFCPFTMEVIDGLVHLIYLKNVKHSCIDEVDVIQWRLEPDGLHFKLVRNDNGPEAEVRAMFEAKPWQQVEAGEPTAQ